MKEDAAKANWINFQRAYEAGHEDYLKLAERCSNYFMGEQWTEEEIAGLGERPHLTLNEILEVVNSVRGQFAEERADIQFKPRRKGATAEVASTLTRLFDHILESNDYHERIEPQVFDDGIIEDRGYFDVRMDYSENAFGEVKITSVDPRTVVLDPDARDYDPSTWKRVQVARWLTLDDIEMYYGKEKRKSVENLAGQPSQTFGHLSVMYQTFGDNSTFYGSPDEASISYVRVVESQHRKLDRIQEFVNPVTGETRPVPDEWEKERVEAVKKAYGLETRRRLTERIRWTVSADHVLIYDDWSDYDDFTIVPYFPIFRRGRPSGLVRHLLDPQDQLNKIESQTLHTINTTANSGWMVESGSLVNMDEHELEERGAETGLVMVYGKNRQPPVKINPNTIPSGLEQFSSKSLKYIQEIPGASPLLGKQPNPEVSGVAMERAQSRALLGLRTVFDNFSYTRKLLARRILDCVQTFYSEERVYFITDWRNPEASEEQLMLNQRAATGVVNDVTVGEYEVVASSMPARDTWEDTQFAQMVELRNAGVMIPDHHVILASQLHGKRQIADQVKQMQGLGEQSQAQQQVAQLELRKLAAQVSEMEAKAQATASSAQLNQAKVQTEIAGEQREQADMQSQYQMELARLRADIEKKMMDIQSDQQLAEIHTDAKQAIARYNAMMNQEENAKDRDKDLSQTQMEAMVEEQKTASQQQVELDKLRAQAYMAQQRQQGNRGQGAERQGLRSGAMGPNRRANDSAQGA